MMKNSQKIISFLVSPHPSIADPRLRRQAQFMSALILVVIPVGFIAELYYLSSTPDWVSFYLCLVGATLFVLIYLLNRTPWVTAASYLNIAVSTVMITWVATNDPSHNFDMLNYLLYPIIVGVYFFGYPQCVFISLSVLTIVFFFPFVFPAMPPYIILNGPFSVLLFFSVMMHVLKSYRGMVESDRQRDLMEHEERYRALLETSYEGICSQVDGKIIEANPGLYRLFGFNPDEVIGKDVLSLFVEADREGLYQKNHRVLVGKREIHMLKRDGTIFPAEVASHLQHTNKRTVEVIAIRDITVRKWSEAALQQAYDEMEHTVEERTGELTMANTRLQREVDERKEAEKLQAALHRISESTYSTATPQALFPVIHKIIAELIPARNLFIALYDAEHNEVRFPYFVDEFDSSPAPQPLGQGPTDWVIRNGEPLLLLTENLKQYADILAFSAGAVSDNWLGVPLKRYDGITIGALVVQNYINSKTPGMRYTERDKTILNFVSSQIAMSIERQRAEHKLAASEERFRSISEIATDFAYSYRVDETGEMELEWITEAIATISGYPLEEISRKGPFEQNLVHKDDQSILRQRKKRLLSNQIDTSEVRIVTQKGGLRYLRQIGRPVFDPDKGRVVRILGTGQDITERKLVEYELLKAHQEQEQRVTERTAELTRDNEVLRARIVELQEVEQALRNPKNRSEVDIK